MQELMSSWQSFVKFDIVGQIQTIFYSTILLQYLTSILTNETFSYFILYISAKISNMGFKNVKIFRECLWLYTGVMLKHVPFLTHEK